MPRWKVDFNPEFLYFVTTTAVRKAHIFQREVIKRIIHNNPLQPHWCLAERAEEYPWSSARFYLMDEPALIALDDGRKLMI
jgi:hypothetical protein